jgi:hypothetical protein
MYRSITTSEPREKEPSFFLFEKDGIYKKLLNVFCPAWNLLRKTAAWKTTLPAGSLESPYSAGHPSTLCQGDSRISENFLLFFFFFLVTKEEFGGPVHRVVCNTSLLGLCFPI